MFDRPQWRFKFDGADYEYRGYVGAADAVLLKKHAGLGVMGFLTNLTLAAAPDADPSALVALVFLAKRHAGENVSWDELVEAMVGDNDLLALVQSIEPIEDEKPAGAADAAEAPVEDAPPKVGRARKTAA